MSNHSPFDDRVAALAARIPNALRFHARIAYDLAWTWRPGGEALFRSIDEQCWLACERNPVALLATAPRASLERAARDGELTARARAMSDALDAARAEPMRPGPSVAFFCAEFAIHSSLAIYGGGLGVLAGDLLKEASDARANVCGVGLLYHRGYFRQRLDPSGRQHEYWTEATKELWPILPVVDERGAQRSVVVSLRGHDVRANIYQVQVGRVPLFLLDADVPENAPLDRWITAQLYVADRPFRLMQYALLGIGGVRALRAMGLDPDVIHMNEGHPALAALEIRREARGKLVFTTHTPVAAGNEHYDDAEVARIVSDVPLDEVLALGRGQGGSFGMTELALRVARSANAVSARHGEVARAMWRGIRSAEAPIHHVTNGVHLPTWMAPPMRSLLGRHLGPDWERRAADPETWKGVDRIPDEELWAVRNELRAALVAYVRERSVVDRLARGESIEYVEAAACTFDPHVLTVGFARRVASYKRLHLIIADPARALGLLGSERPMQVVLAGKAHPRDEPAKDIITRIFTIKRDPIVGRRVAYLEDYELSMAQTLVAGCDVWVNLPRPPLEASGTSGMKAALNGGLNLAVLDGWWPEAFDGTNGWAIASATDGDADAQDRRDAAALYDIFEREVVPSFHQRDAAGIPRAFVARIRASLRTIGPRFCASRMLDDYARRVWSLEP